ncbi:MAG: phytoene/squalene synthase family protein [Gammaproteobacteria bacterium]|tara:strand:+ start:277 stop:1332 length:1056 start_codon:yes stop_codon:yes gene_type:complete
MKTFREFNTVLNELDYQHQILQRVSRTFALTIPQLPESLQTVISNAYLLCRIADTIEDDKTMSMEKKKEFSEMFIDVVKKNKDASVFSKELFDSLAKNATEAEHDLIANTKIIIQITHSFNKRQLKALERCVSIMCEGMSRYQNYESLDGLRNIKDMNNYCYFVAGVVGEMLTELFCDYSNEINNNQKKLMELSVSFGQGLQMTNILKDIWDDHDRGVCWLPKEHFKKFGVHINNKIPGKNSPEFNIGLIELLGISYSHLENALTYTLLIPKNERGLRKFCLWAIGMAVFTLENIRKKPNFTNGNQVKISRLSVKIIIMLTSFFVKNDNILRFLFKFSGRHLPRIAIHERL